MIKYIVMMPNSWGSGDTIAEAETSARKEGRHGRKKVPRKCWQYDTTKTETAYINDMGSLCWMGERPTEVKL